MKDSLNFLTQDLNNYTVENTFSLDILHKSRSARIKMMMLRDPINTADIPHTYQILKKLLPNVLTTECFNEQNLPFRQEVKNTEIGHLFEHILLEYMCQLKITRGYSSAVFAGRTRWNWERDPRGLFHISVNCPLRDHLILKDALHMSIALMRIILNFDKKSFMPYQTYFFSPYLESRNSQGLKNGKRLKKSK